MAEVRGYVENLSVGRAGTGTFRALRSTPDGALFIADANLAASFEGRLFGANMGVVTTPVTTAATTAITNTIAHAWVRVPALTAIVPVYCRVVVESSGATTQGEGSVIIAQNDIGVTGAVAVAGPISLNTAAPVTSNCLPRQLGTATTAPTNPIELTRFSFAASAVNQHFEWNARELGIYPVVRGAGTWAIYLGGNAVVYYAQMIWAEFPEGTLS